MKAIAGFSALLAEGRSLEQAKQWEEAAAAFQKIVDQDAANAQAVPRLLIAYRKLKDYRKELAVIDGALAAYGQREKATQQKWIAAHPQAARAGKAVLRNLGATGTSALGEDPKVAALIKRRAFLEKRVGGKKKATPSTEKPKAAAKEKAAAAAKKQAAEEKVAARAAAKEKAAAEKAEKEAAKKKAVEQRKATAVTKKFPTKPTISLFIVTLRYLVYPDKLAAEIPAHDAYIDKHINAGAFLASGIQTPSIGETIIATAKNRTAIERIANTDPFVRKKWVTVDIMEFSASRMGKGWKKAKSK